ncbi:MAG: DUF1223 domain-containing protein [Pseudomonadota bacterium]
MRITLLALALLVTTLTVLSLGGGAQTLQKLPPATAATSGPVVAELFTSQSCSSCPPAEKLFSELAEREDLIVLEWHVDYWDRLVHGRAGAWKDPYSNPDYTARQRQYNRALRGTGGAYTPQAVINGASETVGHRASEIARLISHTSHATAALEVSRAGDITSVEIGAFDIALKRPAEIFQLTLLPEQSTSVPRGENRGVHLFSRNVVLDAMQVGTYSGDAMSFDIKTPSAEYGCAIIIQEKRGNRLGPILGASYCS